MPVEFAPEAVEDVRRILEHILQKWSYQQFDRYQRKLQDAIDHIEESPNSWRSKDRKDIVPGARSILVGNHHIYYKSTGSKVQVIRVLHEEMDPEKELD